MLPQDSRSGDRLHYTMKTSARSPAGKPSQHNHSHSHSRSHSHSNSPSSFRLPKASTPMASPRMPHSAGQPCSSKPSPGGAVPDVRTPSPNYFGLIVDPATDPHDSAVLPRSNWSPPTSSVKSFAAAIPKQLPLDANPEYEAFRRQADANRGRSGFSLSTSNFAGAGPGNTQTPAGAPAASSLRSRPPRWHTHGSDASSEPVASRASTTAAARPAAVDQLSRMEVDADSNSLHDSAYVSSDSKRNSVASPNPPIFLSMSRHESPASFTSPFAQPPEPRSALSKVDDRHPRLSMMEGKAERSSPAPLKANMRADTVPASLESGEPGMIVPSHLKQILDGTPDRSVLLLDLRVMPLYAQSRIKGALNLCIPTTLLKRATFNLQKLQQTFHSDEDQNRFSRWRETTHLVVYDAFSSDKRDAVSAMNTIKKFTNEGYSGVIYILRGGFNDFVTAYPQMIDTSSGETSPSPGLSLNPRTNGSSSERPTVAPVIGGVMLPSTTNNPNPFFSNIRQNMDLADGVGQMDIALPPHLEMEALPSWLRAAAESGNHGKQVSDKFLHIELNEQSRMKNAYSVVVPEAGCSGSSANDIHVQLSGIEKGGKNRYKDILPFEHARVHLQGRADGACDYVNASHIKSSRSHKRYIATQGPLPATFEDFWSVIWDQDVRVIVMLTAESEGGQLKCHPYWRGRDFGAIKMRLLSEKKVSLDIDKHRSVSGATLSTQSSHSSQSGSASQSQSSRRDSYAFPAPSQAEVGRRRANTTTTFEGSTPTPAQSAISSYSSTASDSPYVIIRKFALSHAAHPFAPIREITHLHYPSWPDFGAPAQPSHLLALVELANVMQRAALPLDVKSVNSSSSSSSSASNGSSSDIDYAVSPPSPVRHRPGPKPVARPNLDLSWQDEVQSVDVAVHRPMLVHCSAGCGRTGTFCTVDSVIDMLKRQRMRALHQANRRIAAADRRIAEQAQANPRVKTAVPHQFSEEIDTDGDVSMDDEPYGADDGTGEMDNSVSSLTDPPQAASFMLDTDSTSQTATPSSSSGQTPTLATAAGMAAMGGPFSMSRKRASPPATGRRTRRQGGAPQEMGEAAADTEEDDSSSDADSQSFLDVSYLGDDALDLVATTVEEFRGQRLSMVQSLRQFVLCYETIIEWVWRLQEHRATGLGEGNSLVKRSTPGLSLGSVGRLRSGSLDVTR